MGPITDQARGAAATSAHPRLAASRARECKSLHWLRAGRRYSRQESDRAEIVAAIAQLLWMSVDDRTALPISGGRVVDELTGRLALTMTAAAVNGRVDLERRRLSLHGVEGEYSSCHGRTPVRIYLLVDRDDEAAIVAIDRRPTRWCPEGAAAV